MRRTIAISVMVFLNAACGGSATESLTAEEETFTTEVDEWCEDHLVAVFYAVQEDLPSMAVIEDRDVIVGMPDAAAEAQSDGGSDAEVASVWRSSAPVSWEESCLEARQAMGGLADGVWVWCRANITEVAGAAKSLGMVDELPEPLRLEIAEMVRSTWDIEEELGLLMLATNLPIQNLDAYGRACQAGYDAR